MINIFHKKEKTFEPHLEHQQGKAKMLQVLVVESDMFFFNKLSSMLRAANFPDQDMGFELAAAHSLRDAIDKMELNRFDVILTDINLADASGFLVLEELIEFGDKTPIIILTNINNWSMIMQSADAGVSDFLLKKTLDSDLLVRSIFYAIQRKKLETRSERSEQSYKALLEVLPAALVRMNRNGKFQFVNDKFRAMVGASMENLVGKKFGDFFDQATTDKLKKCHEEIISSNTHQEIEISPMILGQSPKPFLYAASASRDSGGEVNGVQGLLFDVSNQKRQEADKFAKQSLETLQSGLGKLANELNNSLASILLDTENLGNAVGKNLDPQALLRIKHSVEEARSVLRPFLITAEQVGPRSEILDPNKLMNNVLFKLRKEFPKEIQFELDFPEQIDYVKGDASLLDKLFSNVVRNACEASNDKGIVHIQTKQEQLNENHERFKRLGLPAGTYVLVSVKDSGSGIDSKLAQRVFEPFYTTKDKEHNGTGLTEAFRIIQSHHGNMFLKSNPETGTEVQLFIPMAACSLCLRGSSSDQREKQANTPKMHILLVDDEESILMSLQTLLQQDGHRVTTACNGADALGKFNESRFDIDLVMTAFDMPVMGGEALVNTLRQIAPSLKIILCTGVEFQSQTDKVNELPVDATLFKPFTADQLRETLANLSYKGKIH